MEVLIKKVLLALMENPPSIVVFVGDLSQIPCIYTSLVQELPQVFSCPIDIQDISTSTTYLKGHKYCVSVYHDSCFRYVSTHEFLDTHYNWLRKQVKRLYGKQNSLTWFSYEDLFQEVCMKYLDRILSKYDNQCNLRSFVYNRLRRYCDYIIKEQLRLRVTEIEAMLCTLDK